MSPTNVIVNACSSNIWAGYSMIDHLFGFGVSDTLGSYEEYCALIEERFIFLDSLLEEF
jgi:ABC-type amino acid transport system permease subunit